MAIECLHDGPFLFECGKTIAMLDNLAHTCRRVTASCLMHACFVHALKYNQGFPGRKDRELDSWLRGFSLHVPW